MAKQVIRRQGSSSEHAVFTGAEGEWTHDNTLNTGRFHDGNLAGGYPALLSNNINELSTSTDLDGSNFGELIVADSTSSSFTITLPDPSVVGSGWQVAIKKAVDANSVTVSPFDGEGIDGDTSVVLENAENALQVRTDGTSWYALRLNNFDDAQEILYDNSTSGLSATTVKGAIDEVVSDSADFATLDGGNTFNGNQTLNDDLSVNGDVSFQSYSFPSTDGASGEALLTDGAGNLSFGPVGEDIIQEGNSSVEVIDSGVGRIEFTTDGSESMRIDDNGNVGVGTANPTSRMEVAGESGSADIARLTINEKFNNGSTFFGLDFKRTYTDTGDDQPAGFIHIQRIGTRNNAGMLFGIGDEDDSVQEHMRLDKVGNLQFNSGYGSVFTAYGCRAWVNFDGTGTVSIRESGNVSSITDNGTGDYTVNFATAMPDTSYSALASTGQLGADITNRILSASILNTSSIKIRVNDTTNDPSDNSLISIAIFR